MLFDLDVRDTQVGLKLFRRELVDAVVPHLLVKRYAFDLKLLAVANDSGFRRIEELPVRLDYRFSESGLDLLAVAQALVDTAAIFYRLRILQYYRRRRRIVGERSAAAPLTTAVAFVGLEPDAAGAATLDRRWTGSSTLRAGGRQPRRTQGQRRRRHRATTEVLEQTDADLIAFLTPGVLPGTNWLGRCSPTSRIQKSSPWGGRSCRASRAT